MASPQIDVDEIIETLAQIRQRGHSAHTVFRDWINLMLYALQRRDDPYLEIVDDYRERSDMDHPTGSGQSTSSQKRSASCKSGWQPRMLTFLERSTRSLGCPAMRSANTSRLTLFAR